MSGQPVAPAGRAPWIATLGLGLFGTYLATVLLLDEPLLPGSRSVADWMFVPPLALFWIGLAALLRAASRRNLLSPGGAFALGTLGVAATLSLLALDVAFSVVLNLREGPRTGIGLRRQRDAHLWLGELTPRWYQPGEGGYRRHKPDVILEGTSFGEFYDADMLRSPTLRDRVLEARRIRFRIDEHGFRETTPLAEARVFALGDSFVFGFGLDQEAVWTERLEARSGHAVYNLGVSATGPGVQLRLLEHLLEGRGERARIEDLVWMIFEGNDLENSYATHDDPQHAGVGASFRGTLVELLRELALRVKRQSVIDRWRTGRLRARRRPAPADPDPYHVEGVCLETPLYWSVRHGPRLFNPDHIRRGAKDRDYVTGHPNWPALLATLDRMRSLSRQRGFRVHVALAPTAARLHGPGYEAFPDLSAEPHFLDAVAEQATARGFHVIDLLEGLREPARDGLLYFRDDHHWNARGNEAVAEILSGALAVVWSEPSAPNAPLATMSVELSDADGSGRPARASRAGGGRLAHASGAASSFFSGSTGTARFSPLAR